MTAELRDTAVIVVNFNSAHDVASLLAGLPTDATRGVLVVENGSDDSATELRLLEQLSSVHVVRADENRGYAAGVNDGLRAARAWGCAYAVVVNPDSRPTIDSLVAVRRALADAGVVGVQQVTGPPERPVRYVTAAVGQFPWPRPFACPGCSLGVHDVAAVSGAILGIDIEVARRAGGLDERFFHYKEEVDFCRRAASTGSRIRWLCRPEVWHARGMSLPRRSPAAHYYRVRNEILFARVVVGPKVWAYPRLSVAVARLGADAVRDRAGRAAVRAMIDGVRGRGGMVPQ